MKRAALLLLLILVAISTSACMKIEPGEVGVRTNLLFFRGVAAKPVMEGYRVRIPGVIQIDKYNIKRRAVELSEVNPGTKVSQDLVHQDLLLFNSKDGQKLWCDIQLEFGLDAQKVPAMHRSLGPLFFENSVLPNTVNEVRLAITAYDAQELFLGTKREDMEEAVMKRLQEKLGKEGIIIYGVFIKHFVFREEYQNKIEEAQIKAQELQIKLQEERLITQENKNRLAREEGAASAEGARKVIAAEKAAEALKTEAEAEKEANVVRAEGRRALNTVEAEYMKQLAQALGSGDAVAKLELAKNISDKIQVWGVPTGGTGSESNLLGLFGIMGGVNELPAKAPAKQEKSKAPEPAAPQASPEQP